jgi:phenylpropionate dioxygenase-like ring-hydroxylating dioxygenase large terminal subunit
MASWSNPDQEHVMKEPVNLHVEELSEPLTFSVEPYISREYAAAESDRLWPKVWQHAGRVEELPNVGDFLTYDIGEDSILVVRAAEGVLKAYHNVCSHRGRRLVDTPAGAHSAHGNKHAFICGFHSWRYDLNGTCTFKLDEQDWKGELSDACTRLSEVKVDTWGGWIFVNMDPTCVSLREYLEPAASHLDPFELDKMRYKWRQWVIFDCNWKTAIEAFMEPYHVTGTHTQLLKYGQYYAYSAAHGRHGVSGFDERDPSMQMSRAARSRARAKAKIRACRRTSCSARSTRP